MHLTPLHQLELPSTLRDAMSHEVRDCIASIWASVLDDTFEGTLTPKQHDALEGFLKVLLYLGDGGYIAHLKWKAYLTRFRMEAEKAAYLRGGLYVAPGEDILAGITEWAVDEMPVRIGQDA